MTRIDWPRLLEDIAYALGEPSPTNPVIREPANTMQTAKHLDVPRGTLRNWLDGAEPKHADGEILIEAWCKITGKPRIFVPALRAERILQRG